MFNFFCLFSRLCLIAAPFTSASAGFISLLAQVSHQHSSQFCQAVLSSAEANFEGRVTRDSLKVDEKSVLGSAMRTVQNHLIIGDADSAVAEAAKLLEMAPSSLSYVWMIKSLAAAGQHREMLSRWRELHCLSPESAMQRELLEQMCWGILKKGYDSGGIMARLIAIVGSALAQDIRAVPVLLAGMQDANSHIRTVSVQLASLYGDASLRRLLCRMFREEKVQEVYLQVIKAIGTLKMEELIPELMELIEKKKTPSEVKRKAVHAIAACKDSIAPEEIVLLASSKKAYLRILACECMILFHLIEQETLLPGLIDDANPEVRCAALKAAGFLRVGGDGVLSAAKRASQALDPLVSMMAGWSLLLLEQPEGKKVLEKWLLSDQADIRAAAASAVSASGAYGLPIALSMIQETEDDYVRVNLAYGLIGQRVECNLACQVLEDFLRSHAERIMEAKLGDELFQPIVKSKLLHHPGIANFPEVMNQTIRLQLLNLLAILQHQGSLDLIKKFFKGCHWKVTGLAAELLLQEGDAEAIEQIRCLLDDPDREICTEAALVLAVWGRDFSAVPTLLSVYPDAERPLKIKILEALGRIGDNSTIPFLIERLNEPSAILRMIAAAVLIQTLNS